MSNKNCVGNCIKNNENTIHPFNLNIIDNNSDQVVCPSKTMYNKKNKNLSFVSNDCNVLSSQEIINYMNKPYVYIDHSYLVDQVFNINEVDDISLWINKNLSNPKRYICRVLNLWIKSNLKDLKKYQQLLIKIIGDVVIKKNIVKKKDEDVIRKEILPKFIKSWIDKVDEKYFYFDIFSDLEKFLSM